MKELDYTVLDLERWNNRGTCWFCDNSDNKAVCQIRVRSKVTDRIIQNSKACEVCRDKLDELPKCDKCGRLRTRLDIICACIRRKEATEEKELPVLPDNRRPGAFYERQINSLREEKEQITEEANTHLEALEIAEDWHKRQKQELLDRIKQLEEENKQLKAQTSHELVNKIKDYEAEIIQLKTQLEQFTYQQVAQVEVKTDKKQFAWLKLRK